MCELIKHTLTQCRASVIMVTNGVEGLQLLKKEKMDILISDIARPEKDGYQFIREVRMLPTECGGKIPAIALTAFARNGRRSKRNKCRFSALPNQASESTGLDFNYL